MKLLHLAFFILITLCTYGQKEKAAIEVSSYFNFDKYPEFRYSPNPTYDHVINIKGDSWGIDVGYKFKAFKAIYLKPFIGYYRFSFNKLDKYNELFGVHVPSREISSPPSPIFWTHSTDKYFYNCLNMGFSVEKDFFKNKFLSLSGGLLINGNVTFSQKYYIVDNPEGLDRVRKKNRVNIFGLRADAFAKILIPIKQFSIGPFISLPIYTLWKTDTEFPSETNNDIRNKWLNGWGIGISANYIIN